MTATQDIHDLRAAHRDALDRMEELNEIALSEDRDFTDEEQAEYSELEGRCDSLQRRIQRQEQLRERRDRAPEPPPADTRNAPQIHSVRDFDGSDFRSFGEFIHAVAYRPGDQRLRPLLVEDRESPIASTLAMGDGMHDDTAGPLGGYAVPDQFRGELLQVAQQGSIFRPRARVIPAGSPPDAPITMPALDQTAARNRYGGVEMEWIEEGATKPQTDLRLRQVTLQPHELAGSLDVTDKLLRNWQAADTLIRQLLSGALVAAEDHAFLSGTGGTQPLGILNAPATYHVPREVAGEIHYEDLVNMTARLLRGGPAIWVGSQAILPTLLTMRNRTSEGGSGDLIFQLSARDGEPDRLMGRPIVWSERSPALGEPGDLVLVDPNYYLIKDGSGPFVAASPHVKFRENQTVIKIFTNVDGKPWLTAPMPLENSYVVSPFVALDDPEAGDGGGGDGDGAGDGDG